MVIQEIFGVNHHIRSVRDRLAAEGYVAIAPSIFDRTQPDFQCGYSPDEIATARKFIANPDWAAMLRDTQAAIDAGQGCRPGRHHRLLPRRQHRLCGGDQAVGAIGRRRLLRRRRRPRPTTSRKCRRNCISAKRMRAFR